MPTPRCMLLGVAKGCTAVLLAHYTDTHRLSQSVCDATFANAVFCPSANTALSLTTEWSAPRHHSKGDDRLYSVHASDPSSVREMDVDTPHV